MAASRILWVGETVLPAPTELKIDDEIIWSSDTGRAANGVMIGDVVAEKKTLNISWGILTAAEMSLISSTLVSGFFPFSFSDAGVEFTIDSYRGTLSKTVMGDVGDGNYYYRNVGVTIIQR